MPGSVSSETDERDPAAAPPRLRGSEGTRPGPATAFERASLAVRRRATAVSAAIAALITAPLVGLALRADETYKIYLFGSEYAQDPIVR